MLKDRTPPPVCMFTWLGFWLLLGIAACGSSSGQESQSQDLALSANPAPILPDSLPQEVENAHQGALCTLLRFRDMFQTQICQAETPEAQVAAWNGHPDLIRWLGRLEGPQDSLAVQELQDRLNLLIGYLEKRSVRYQVEDSWLGRCQWVKTRAYVRPRETEPTIYLCPAWFEQSPVHRVATVIHELYHLLGYGHPRDVDLPLEALALAREHPAEARLSPENYESLMELYVCDP